MKYNEWLDLWLNKYVKISIKYKTYDYYKRIINTHIKPILGEYDLNDLTIEVLQDFVIDKLKHGNLLTGKPLANSSVINVTKIVKQSINQAFLFNISNINNSSKIKLPTVTSTKISAFEKQEQEVIEKYCLNNTKSNYIGIIICYCLFSYKSSPTILAYSCFFRIIHFNICSTLGTFCCY